MRIAQRGAVALLAIAAAGTAAAEWTPVAPDNGTFAAYADRSTIRRAGPIASMLGMYDFARGDYTPEGARLHSTTVEREYDCRQRLVRLVAYADHAERLGRGAVVSSMQSTRRWEPIVEESLDLAYWRIACGAA